MSVIVGEYHELQVPLTLRFNPYPEGTIVKVIGLAVNTERPYREIVTIECEDGEVYRLGNHDRYFKPLFERIRE
jgi:hypothetical protein